jgi:hypothetical protein
VRTVGSRSRVTGRCFALALLPTITLSNAASAQLAAWLDGTGTRIAYSGVPGASAVNVSPAVQFTRPLGWFAAAGSFAQVEGDWSLQGQAAGAVFTRGIGGFQLEGGGAGAASTHEDGTSTNEVRGRVRLHWSRPAAGLWTGVQLGTASNSLLRQSIRAAEGGLWVRVTPLTIVFSGAPTCIGDSLQYLDGEATARLVRGSVELTASGGVRQWHEPDGAGTDAWGGVGMVVWLNRHLAIVGGGGSYLADYAQGFPGGSYVTLGVRVATRRPAESEPTAERIRQLPRGRYRPDAPAFQVRTLSGARRLLRLYAPGAKRVEIMGEFTSWTPVSLQAKEGKGPEWTVALVIPAGVYRMNVRIDGGAWSVPIGVPAIADDFGPVGILRVGK